MVVSHNRIVPPEFALARVVPSGENAIEWINLVYSRVFLSCPVAVSHSRIVSSQPILARMVPSGENATGSPRYEL